MSVDIRPITADEYDAFRRAMSVPFSFDPTPEGTERARQTVELDRLRAAFDGAEIVATFGAYSLELTGPGGTIPTAGTSAITVLPTHRRQGLLRRLMMQHLEEVHERGEPLAALWASESSIYGRFGYGPASDYVFMTLPKPFARLQQPVDICGTMRLVGQEEAQAAFPPILAAAVAQRPGMYARRDTWWAHRIFEASPSGRGGATAHRRVLYVRDGQPQGYVIYRTKQEMGSDDSMVRIIELIAAHPEAEKALWQYIFGIDLMESIQAWNRPVDDPLGWWLEDPRRMQRRVFDALWLRPIDVVKALCARRYASPGCVVFRLIDSVCPWNEGVYRLEADACGTGYCSRTDASPELELTAYTLGAIYLGGRRCQALARAGLVTGSPAALRRADALFAWDPLPWCHEPF